MKEEKFTFLRFQRFEYLPVDDYRLNERLNETIVGILRFLMKSEDTYTSIHRDWYPPTNNWTYCLGSYLREMLFILSSRTIPSPAESRIVSVLMEWPCVTQQRLTCFVSPCLNIMQNLKRQSSSRKRQNNGVETKYLNWNGAN